MTELQKQKAAKMLRDLRFMPQFTFDKAIEVFNGFHFGLKQPTIKQSLNQMDFVCKIQEVGKYARRYPDD